MSRHGGERSLASHDDLHSRCSASQVLRSSYPPLQDTRACRYDSRKKEKKNMSVTVGRSGERGTKTMSGV